MKPAADTLLVEDDEFVIEAYTGRFDDEGIAVDVARTWDEALALFRVAGHQLVIADYNLPGDKHGLMLLVEMKRLLPSAQLVLISGAMSVPAAEYAEQVDFIDHFFAKDSSLIDTLVPLAENAGVRARQHTDWKQVGHGFLSSSDAVDPALRQIDDLLRADVRRRRNG